MIGRRAAILSTAALLLCAAAPSRPLHYEEVKRILDRLAELPARPTAEAEQENLFERLEALGPSAVPAMIDLMDDRRPLRFHSIGLTNHAADAFEGRRLYGPELIVDAVAAILNQITGENFGFIYNGATDAERRAAVAGWRRYRLSLASRADTSSARPH
jgi:hypothetical protein